jgi:hypothetical protein
VCFGEKSIVAKEARAWISHLDQFESSSDSCFKADPDFGAQVLGLIDLTFFQLCDACLKAPTIDEVDFTSIALHNKRVDILQNCFQANKLAHLLQNSKKTHGLEGEDGDETTKDGKKKTKLTKDGKDKFQYRDLGALVHITSQNQDWKIIGNKYRSIFIPDLTASTPPFNSTGLITCNKWHVQGFCYEKCDRKASHKPFESASHKSNYDKWIREIKAKNP